MALKKDKQKVIAPSMTDEQIRLIFNYEPEDGVNADFHILEKAYRGFRAEDFKRFLDFFCAENRDINSTNKYNETLLTIISKHSSATEYIKLLQDKGAKS